MLIKITAEKFMRQYLAGKSIKELSQETGMGEWAIKKQIQRQRYKQLATQEQTQNKSDIENTNTQVTTSKNIPWKDLGKIAGAIAAMLAIYFIYMETKKMHVNSSQGRILRSSFPYLEY